MGVSNWVASPVRAVAPSGMATALFRAGDGLGDVRILYEE